MLTSTQSLRIVIKCIKALTDVKAVQVNDELEDVKITDDTRVRLLRGLIVSSETNGVPSKKHKIAAAHLAGIKPGTTVGDVAEIVERRATPV